MQRRAFGPQRRQRVCKPRSPGLRPRPTQDLGRQVAWAGQAAAMARAEPAGEIVARLWTEAEALLPS